MFIVYVKRKTFTLLERLEGLDHLIGRKKTANDFVRKMSLVFLMYKIQISSKSLREVEGVELVSTYYKTNQKGVTIDNDTEFFNGI